ncbi:MAG: hypothetical protein CMD43_00255 [Gammaproteobacteria bacterium]|nr:hypothetical protein [Gammaproteobacteria bacterium]|tara:strand:+ start:56 stop:721 length:666 start_codon:yes stop_codon:yes gene_type:complete
MLEIKDLCKSYREHNSKQIDVLSNVNLNIPGGAIVALKGISGSGKSTLLNLISGLDVVSSGQITFFNESVTSMNINQLSRFRKLNIGMIFQFFNLINDLTVYENILLPLLLTKVNKKDAHNRVMELLDNIGLAHRKDFKTNLLSGGESQRVATARALIINPRLILADEPTGNLDKDNANLILDLLIDTSRKNNSSLIIVTHNDNIINRFDKVYTLKDGTVN